MSAINNPLNLRQLQHLLLLAEELHFARAAERAFLSQSAFSRSIQNLEASVGMRLFDRDLRSVRATPAGVRLIARARRLLSSADDLSREMDLLRSGELGNVNMGVGPFSGLTLLPAPLAQMQRDHPDVQVRLDVASSQTLLQQLDDERIDFFIAEIRELPAREDCVLTRIGWLAGAFYCRVGHPLASRTRLRFADLKDARFASVHMPQSMKKTLDKLMAASGGSSFSVALECESTALLRDLCLASDAIMLAFPRAVQNDLEAGLLQRLPVQDLDALGPQTPLRTELGLVRLKERTLTPASEILMRLVREEAKSQLGGGGR
jgi:DNA-binding transcriptional LysR family regulator